MGNKKAFGNAWHLDSQMSEPKLLVSYSKQNVCISLTTDI